MKILFMTLARQNLNELPLGEVSDYMSDLLFHGLRSLHGDDVVDFPRKNHLYKDYQKDISQLWGRGFSYSKLLDSSFSYIDYPNKELIDGCDLVVMSVHHTVHKCPDIINFQLDHLRKNYHGRIAVVDGHDLTDGYNFAFAYTPYIFKREIVDDYSPFLPISFGIPKEKIRTDLAEKKKVLSSLLPADHSHPNRKTHSYNTEQEYYDEYAQSYFALTCKKGGWDCMRHYEIMANGCIPLFADVEDCPKNTLTTLPKECLTEAKKLSFMDLPALTFTKNEITDANYVRYNPENDWTQLGEELCEDYLDYCRAFCTTEAMAESFLERIK